MFDGFDEFPLGGISGEIWGAIISYILLFAKMAVILLNPDHYRS
jgi:membrane associated rhomboid family serine protease